MSSTLSRAFTTRRHMKSVDTSTEMPKRSMTTKQMHRSGTIRNMISGPVELLSTTNMLSYNAPDIFPSNASSRSSNSGDDSDRSPSNSSTPMTSPDTSSIESSPTSLEPNHLSCYFGAPSRQSASSDEAPMIPTRALSHTKRTSEAIARKRSTSQMSSPRSTLSSPRSISQLSSTKGSISSRVSSPQNSMIHARSSINMFAANMDAVEHHPFGNELAQVSEIAEEYGITETMTIVDQEEQELASRGLFKFCAEDYMSEIQGLFLSAFGDTKPKMSTMWI